MFPEKDKEVVYKFFPWNNSNYTSEDWFKFFSKAVDDIVKRKATRIERQKIIDRKVRETMLLNPSIIQQSFRNISEDLQKIDMKEKRKTIEKDISKLFYNVKIEDVHVKQTVINYINKLIIPPLPKIEEKKKIKPKKFKRYRS